MPLIGKVPQRYEPPLLIRSSFAHITHYTLHIHITHYTHCTHCTHHTHCTHPAHIINSGIRPHGAAAAVLPNCLFKSNIPDPHVAGSMRWDGMVVWLHRGDSICLAGCSIVDTAWCIQSIEQVLMDKRVMLRDYFSLEINDDGELVSIPLLLKGYSPSLGKLPTFLLRLGPNVSLLFLFFF
jgi:hypothetical protein